MVPSVQNLDAELDHFINGLDKGSRLGECSQSLDFRHFSLKLGTVECPKSGKHQNPNKKVSQIPDTFMQPQLLKTKQHNWDKRLDHFIYNNIFYI